MTKIAWYHKEMNKYARQIISSQRWAGPLLFILYIHLVGLWDRKITVSWSSFIPLPPAIYIMTSQYM